jgi:glycosyltransferase involved in cell wall biosynthesis/uncharacterized coiled-coil DUF342 family protein
MSGHRDFSVIAIIAAYNEADIIGEVVRHLLDQGLGVYLLDHGSTDGTVAEVEPYLGRGVLHIERFSEESSGAPGDATRFAWEAILRRKEALASELDASWFIHHDADELRESPWAGLSLLEAIRRVDGLGYNAVDFEVLNFRPTHDRFRRGDDVRAAFPFYEPGDPWDRVQIKCWKKVSGPVDLVSTGGHEAIFPDRKVFPIRFILRHYPIRSQEHGERKVFRERLPRFLRAERERGWHIQYDGITERHSFVRDPGTLSPYDAETVRLRLALNHRGIEELGAALADSRRAAEKLETSLDAVRRDLEQRLDQSASERGLLAEQVVFLRGQAADLTVERDELQAAQQRGEMQLADLATQRDGLAELTASLTAERDELQAAQQRGEMQLADLAAQRDGLAELTASLTAKRDELQAAQQRGEMQLADLATQRDRLAERAASLTAERDELQAAQQRGEMQLADLAAQRDRLAERAASLQAQAADLTALRDRLQATQRQRDTQLAHLTAQRDHLVEIRVRLEAGLRANSDALATIEESLAWIAVSGYRRLVERALPRLTPRRRLYDASRDRLKIRSRKAGSELDGAGLWRSAERPSRGSASMTGDQSPASISRGASLLRTVSKEPLPLRLSVVIPTKNGRAEDFEETLRAIYAQERIAELEVIVVDSGSSDGTAGLAEGYGAKVYRIPPEEFNHGVTRNYGADQGRGDLLAFMVQDAIPATADLFYEMARALLDDPKLAGVSVRQVPKANADTYACWERWQHHRALFQDRPTLPVIAGGNDALSPLELRRLAGLDNVCSMVRRNLWEEIRFQPTEYAEDLEFGLTCVRRGYRIALLSHRAVIHSHTRPPLYFLSRYYVDRQALLDLLEEEERSGSIDEMTGEQLVSSLKELYLALTESMRHWDPSARHDPAALLQELLASGPVRQGMPTAKPGEPGEPTLDRLFAALDGIFDHEPPVANPCVTRFQETVNAILAFLAQRYPRLTAAEVRATAYKAYANTAGNLLGEHCFRKARRGEMSRPLKTLDGMLRRGVFA